ncbi:CBL-interacting serine/threonine-protein kinase 23 [Aduncisulcus paluster]|uniref:non-specific serine/threonine protein kinase n=1 Tax=Aduncisulcus paluster TaxID=2918883 RepID=A0ABQ5KE70_9EUKA|nr:CBL-interacting serine/threonine-protein kinase 23 [Aduncisulcus paluster]
MQKVDKYELARTLGEGTFGKVKYGVDTSTGHAVAVKIIHRSKLVTERSSSRVKKEIDIMRILDHPNIVKLYEVLYSKSKIFLILELVTGGELFDRILTQGKFEEETARIYFQQLVNAVEYMHSKGVAHRDLKPENLLLNEHAILKISDFGLSALMGMGEGGRYETMMRTTCGTPNYVAPEVLAGGKYDGTVADIWSCGVILYAMLAGYLPFEDTSKAALFRRIEKADFHCPPWFSKDAIQVLTMMLKPNPAQRATFATIKQHKWFMHGLDPEDGMPFAVKQRLRDAIERAEDRITDSRQEKKPPPMNVFDIVSVSGFLNFAPLFRRDETQRGLKVFRSTCFISPLSPSYLMRELKPVIEEARAVPIMDYSTWKIRVSAGATGGVVKFNIELHSMSGGKVLCEFRKTQGDLLAFIRIYNKIKDALPDGVVQDEGERKDEMAAEKSPKSGSLGSPKEKKGWFKKK